ncbi:hypothetical protein KCU98_g15342, partial [Aureobasidium melanogenum]
MMFLFSFTCLLLSLLGLSTLAYSCHPSVWVVGLKDDQTIDNHLRIFGRPIPIQERRLDFNGYTASIPDDDKEMFQAIRSDPNLGFLVNIPQDYFSKSDEFLAIGWDEEDDEIYEWRLRPSYHWIKLQHRDLNVIEGSNCGRRKPLTWEVKLEEGYSFDVHISFITQLDPTSLSVRRSYHHEGMYTLIFKSEERERKSLPLLYDDSRVEAIWPSRCYQPEVTYFIDVDSEFVPGWKDPCSWKLGYRQWDKEPIVSIPSKPSTTTLHSKVRSMPSKATKTHYQSHSQRLRPAPIVYYWEAEVAKDRGNYEERIARSYRDFENNMRWATIMSEGIVEGAQPQQKPAADAKEQKDQKKAQKSQAKQKKEPKVAQGGGKKKMEGAALIGIDVAKEDDLSEWYQQVITKGEMLEFTDVPGCYIYEPGSYGIYERIQDFFNTRIRKMGVRNCYFPLFISEANLQREKDHIEGFAAEVAWV